MNPGELLEDAGLKAPTTESIAIGLAMAVMAFGLAASYKKAGEEPPKTIQQLIGRIDLCETALEPAVRRLACGKG